MGFDAWLTLLVVVGVVYALATEKAPLPLVILAGVAVLLIAGVIDERAAFAGFSNPAPLTVAALYVLAGAVEKSGALEHITAWLLGRGEGGDRVRLVRILVPTAAVSGFLNNTPIVAMVAPAVASWARRVGRPASYFLMPISFAAILGGITTLIGTSTNLVVSGLLVSADLPPIGIFEISRVGIPIAVIGVALLVVAAPLVVPARRAPGEEIGSSSMREFTVEMSVQDSGPVAGVTVAEAGLRNLQGVFLIEIQRHGRTIAPVGPGTLLEGGDRLVFAGNVDRVLDLQRIPGLVAAEDKHFMVTEQEHGRRFYEVVVSRSSPLAGSTLKKAGFRARYRAAVFAIHRAGERVAGKLGDVEIGAGDVLLLVADGGWGARWRDHSDFLVVSPLQGGPTLVARKARLVGLVTLALVVTVAAGLIDVLSAALIAALALIVLKVVTRTEARDSIDLEVVVAIAAAFGLGNALSESGLAEVIAGGLVAGLERFGDIGILAGVLVATSFITEVVTNNAAAVLMFPIAMAAATAAGLDPRPFAMAVAVGASMSLLTPIGYQTNTMVYGMGGYRFSDFIRLGGLLTPVMLLVALVVIPMGWPLRP